MTECGPDAVCHLRVASQPARRISRAAPDATPLALGIERSEGLNAVLVNLSWAYVGGQAFECP